jgi:hypothetical protein
VNEEEFPELSSSLPRRGAPRGRAGRGRPTREFESSQRQQARNQKAAEPPTQVAQLPQARPTTPPVAPPAPTNEPTRSGRGKPVRTAGSGRFVESRGKGRGHAPPIIDRNDKRNLPIPKEDARREHRKENINLENEMKNLSMHEGETIVSRDFRRQPTNSKFLLLFIIINIIFLIRAVSIFIFVQKLQVQPIINLETEDR